MAEDQTLTLARLLMQGPQRALQPDQDYWDMSPEEQQLREIRLNPHALNRIYSFSTGIADNPVVSKNLQEMYPATMHELRDRHPDAYDYGRAVGNATGARTFWNWLYGERPLPQPAPMPPRRNRNES